MRTKIKVERLKLTEAQLKRAREQAEIEFQRIAIREYDMQKPINLIISQTINDRLNWVDRTHKGFVCFEAREDDLLFAFQERRLYCYLNYKEIARLDIPNWEDIIEKIKSSIKRKQELQEVLVGILQNGS